ncbi:Sb-PDE family phosphodiesterase [Gammaproteobacteria bacterium]|nr:Sb-PDE family phosphodiesterase [Gammaproteobacteria bacterium]MDB3880693.1 Sb-PDE family phosphodiesterase [Gammaproteobacteria bacterium]MDB4816034.1 Sb-PDE family phosphodiesterase [Gammaproteobacteria bacterium]MDC0577596.1 Sb-PDE family phosphodiesterase [Gammaproteobacteria bacterium]MDC0590300.1 Sb-PDE family phosphodiesterase [Gammaproteobacteria bacterium]|tara:strand:- start:1489 stop:2730 length:1242 start_codon:yes stop_codon:yes gene_type:complete
MKKLSALIVVSLFSLNIYMHGSVNSFKSGQDRSIEFPDTENYLTITSDLHTHSVFSDGHVWPNIRVAEAMKDKLDAIAITEHLEYQPHIRYIPNKNRNIAFLEAKKAAEETDLIVIAGSEITREMPPGHLNAVFIKDANTLFNIDESLLPEARKIMSEAVNIEDLSDEELEVADQYALGNLYSPFEALEEAKRQGAFIFWNHPMWGSQANDGVSRLTEMHKQMIAKDLIHGIEVVNTEEYSEEALQIALDNNLAIIGTSDVHELIEWDYDSSKNEHRPVTLILSEKRNRNSIKEALLDRRTIVFYKNKLIGKEENLVPLLDSILGFKSLGYRGDTSILRVEISNNSSSDMTLKNLSAYNFSRSDDYIFIPKNETKTIMVKTLEVIKAIKLKFEVLNAITAPKKHAVVEATIEI